MQVILDKYIEDVKTGVVPSGIHLRNAIKRYEKDRLNDKYDFRPVMVKDVLDFTPSLTHFVDPHAGRPFEFEPWQVFIVANIYGFYYKDTDRRRFKTVYLEMARKNGKSSMVAALSLHHLLRAGNGLEVSFCANSQEQASIGFNYVTRFGKCYERVGAFKNSTRRLKNVLLYDYTNSKINVLTAKSELLDGLNCSFGVIDEYHEAPDSKVRDVVKTSMIARNNPLLITITTAGFNKSLPCYELRTAAEGIISGTMEEESFFSVIYSIDEGDDWKDEGVWQKSNPNLGVTVNIDNLRDEVITATNNPSDRNNILTKNFNVWCDGVEQWLTEEVIIAATKDEYDINEVIKEGYELFLGVDLAYREDLTALSFLYVKKDEEDHELGYYFINKYYLPEDTLKNNSMKIDSQFFSKAASNGYIKLTEGNVTDHDFITADIGRVIGNIDTIYYDQANGVQWAAKVNEELGNNILYPFGQSRDNFDIYTKAFERLFYAGKIYVDNNPINRYCMRNSIISESAEGKIKPVNNNRKMKIDGVIAMIQALAAYIDVSGKKKSIEIF